MPELPADWVPGFVAHPASGLGADTQTAEEDHTRAGEKWAQASSRLHQLFRDTDVSSMEWLGYCSPSGSNSVVSSSVPANMATSVPDASVQNSCEPHVLQRLKVPESHASDVDALNWVGVPAVILRLPGATPMLGEARAPVALWHARHVQVPCLRIGPCASYLTAPQWHCPVTVCEVASGITFSFARVPASTKTDRRGHSIGEAHGFVTWAATACQGRRSQAAPSRSRLHVSLPALPNDVQCPHKLSARGIR